MEWQWVILLIMGCLLILMTTGLPVAFCFLGVNILGVFIFWGGHVGIQQLVSSIFSSLATFVLIPLPLFILMGELISVSGFAHQLLTAVDQWLGRLPGRLSFVSIAGGVLLSTLTGAAMASLAIMGETLLPEMRKRKYMNPMSLGPILGSSCLAMMIPPSAPAVLFAAIAEISVGKLLIAIIVPGLLLAALYAIYILLRCMLQPHLAPPYSAPYVPLSRKLLDTIRNILPVAVIIFLVIGVMFLGIVGPTEAAATGALGTIIVCAARGKLNWGRFTKAVSSTLRITVMMLMIICGSTAFSQILAYTGATTGLVEALTSFAISPIITLVIMQVIVIILGCLMDGVSIMMITLPIYMPIVHALGFNPYWFGVIALINMDIGGITPPFGLGLFTMKAVAPADVKMQDIYAAATPFILLDILAMALIMFFPLIALWLPSVMR